MPEWKERTQIFHQFTEEGDEVEGVLINAGYVEIQGSPTKRYTLQTQEGPMVFLGGAQIDGLLEDVEMGTMVKLRFTGMTPTQGGFNVKQFRLWVQEG